MLKSTAFVPLNPIILDTLLTSNFPFIYGNQGRYTSYLRFNSINSEYHPAKQIARRNGSAIAPDAPPPVV